MLVVGGCSWASAQSLVASISPSISVLWVTVPAAVEIVSAFVARVPPVVPAAALGEELLEPFQKDGPPGKKGESLTVGQLRSRSRLAFQTFAWSAISEGTKRFYIFIRGNILYRT